MTFKSGISGNPNGRPKGTGSRQQLFSSFVEPHQAALFETAINLALDGNEAMLRLFLDRMLPAKPTDDAVTVQLPSTNDNSALTLSMRGEAILQAVSLGEITPEQGKAIMGVIDTQRKNIETSDLSIRLQEIERTLKQRKKEK
ncbi:hypothetical protein [Legionella tucsonensis]|uniref:DUF5681 domain-containing protein n=1 Tax=Legionella tucsonensis TaxID=40335 RepID=A0A0W0ZXP2_9GAMM|nr:hypothetical protein [Legionella tucsonensis]KTD73916.1 hypothetical protein Ltuc_1763 [Legionella tucsonensis]